MTQCLWVYTEGGQYQGQCTMVAQARRLYCEEHELHMSLAEEKAVIEAMKKRCQQSGHEWNGRQCRWCQTWLLILEEPGDPKKQLLVYLTGDNYRFQFLVRSQVSPTPQIDHSVWLDKEHAVMLRSYLNQQPLLDLAHDQESANRRQWQTDLKLIDGLLLAMMRDEDLEPKNMLTGHTHLATMAMRRLYKAWKDGEFGGEGITATWHDFFQNLTVEQAKLVNKEEKS